MKNLTLGTAQFGLNYGISNKTGKPKLIESLLMLDYAYKLNINSFDTAYDYGNSEVILGTWVKEKKSEYMIFTSKLPSLIKRNILFSELETEVRYYIENSLKNLNISKIDHYLIHDFKDVKKYGAELFKILEKLKKENLIGSYGCSIYSLDELEYINMFNIGSVQIPASIFNQEILESKLLGQMRQNGTFVFVRSIFVQGLIFMNDDEIPEMLYDIKIFLHKLRNLVIDNNITIADAALNYVRNHENTDSIVFGVETFDQLCEIVAIKCDKELDSKIIKNEFSGISSKLIDPRYWR